MRRRIRAIFIRVAIGLLLLVVVALGMIRMIYGGGTYYEDLATDPLLGSDEVEAIGQLPFPAGNVTASPDGRVFVNIHPFVRADRFTDAYLFELIGDDLIPFPDLETQADCRHVFGMNVDSQGRLWLISPATLDRKQTRLQAFDLATRKRLVDVYFEPGIARFAQDFRVTPDGKTMILADTGAFKFTSASLIVVDLETMTTRSILSGHPYTQPQNWMIQTHAGDHSIGWGLITFAVGVDGIALSPDGETLYFAPMSHDTLYRVPMRAVRDEGLSDEQLAQQVHAIAQKPLSDGIETTDDGEVLITDIEHGAIVGIRPHGERRTLVRLGGERISWTDGITIAPGGWVLFTDSEIPSYLDPLLRPPSRKRLDQRAPHTAVYRFRLPREDLE